MPENDFYIGIVQDRFPNNPVDRIVVLPLMKWDGEKNIWTDIDKTRCRQLFPDKGLIVSFIDDTNLLEDQVIKFKVHQNSRYIPGSSLRHAKFSIDKNQFYVLLELLILDFEGSEANLREAVLSGNLVYNHPHNSRCLIALGQKRWLGVLTFKLNDPLHRLIPTDPENWRKLEVRQIQETDRIRPASLDSRIFVDPSSDFGKLVDLDNWQPKVIFVKRLISRLNEHLEKLKSNHHTNPSLDLYEFKKIIRQRKRDKAILHRLQEHENMENLQKEDIDSIIQLLTAMEPFYTELEKIKEATINQVRQETKAKAEQEFYTIHEEKAGLEIKIANLKKETQDLYRKAEEEIEQKYNKAQEEIEVLRREAHEKIELEVIPIKQEKSNIEQQVVQLQKEATEIELTLEIQRNRMNQTLDEFERLLNERLKQIVVEPSSVLAEALANDAFLQLIFGNYKQSLDLKSSTSCPIEIPTYEVKIGSIFETADLLLAAYQKRLERADLDKMLASWTTAIALAGLVPVFKGSVISRALTVFTNHLTYGRCFELPLSPEIISIERLFTIGQSGNASSLGVLDTALLCAASHHEALFMLVLEGLDRAPSQYFLDTLLDWYGQGLMGTLGNNFLSKHLKELWKNYGLADGITNWPSNLLLVATVNGLTDGFPVSSTAIGKIVEVDTEFQGEHLDIHPAVLDQNARKPVGEVAASQWDEWQKKAQDQDVSQMAQQIKNIPRNKQPDNEKKEIALRLFAALLILEKSENDAISLIQHHLLKLP